MKEEKLILRGEAELKKTKAKKKTKYVDQFMYDDFEVLKAVKSIFVPLPEENKKSSQYDKFLIKE